MGFFRFIFKWSLEITGSLIIGYNYLLKPEQQADLYGFYRSCHNSYRTVKHVYAALNQYKELIPLKNNLEEYKKQDRIGQDKMLQHAAQIINIFLFQLFYKKKLAEINSNTAKRLEQLSRFNRGVYMRLGQYIGNMKYAFPPQFFEVLKSLNVKPNYPTQDYKYLKKHLEAQLGKKTKQVFETLNISPIKSELFQQVYKAELAENFLDVNLKVIHPYAFAEAKYDFWFLKKVFDYIDQFKQKNFTQNYPLYLDLLYSKLKQSVENELNHIEQQKSLTIIKQKVHDLIEQQKAKPNTRLLPIYVPYIYPQYTKQKVIIQEYFEGYHLSENDALFKENYNRKNIASDLINFWNSLLEKNQILIESYAPSQIFIRKSRPNEEGPYQLCPLNLSKYSVVPSFIAQSYCVLWKEFVSGKKINPKKPQQRIKSVRTFYDNIHQVSFSLFLKEKEKMNDLKQKVNLVIDSQSSGEFIKMAKSEICGQIVRKLEQKKMLPVSKGQRVNLSEKDLKEYENLKRAFQIQYEPWRLQTLFQTYKEIFREEKHFGLF